MKTCATGFIFLLLSGFVLVACTNGGGLTGNGSGAPSPLPSGGIGLGIPTGRIGVESDPVWGTVAGYTQNKTSQVLAFPPGTMLTVHNLSSVDAHTLNVLATSSGPPPKWPKNPSLSFSPSGNGILGSDYASGSLQPGGSVTLKLSNPGIYLIGCAYHYIGLNMRDVVQVEDGASPGPTASPGPGGYILPRVRGARTRAHVAPPAHAQPHLIDQRGRHFTLASLIGTPLAITFVAARCTDACPLINAQFAATAQRLANANVRARLLTITLDPRHDTPAVMSALARRFEANPRYWSLASGSAPDVDEILKNFGVVARQGEHGYPDAHTTFVYLFDASGNLTQTMLASSALREQLFEALRAGAPKQAS
jgi:cytochrome oxidase Cu insertion factor (SCO1/SenC/PrrC family)